MRPDVLIVWPQHCDYPLWRQQLRRDRKHYARVLISFTDNHIGVDYRDYVANDLSGITECDDAPSPAGGEDWRDAAINALLAASDARWIWFTEQDFFVDEPDRFWEWVQWLTGRFGAVGWRPDDRWHPSCLFVKRSILDRTTRYFGPVPIDHFYTFSKELDELTNVGEVPRQPPLYHHLAGLSRNHEIVHNGGPWEEVYHPDEFLTYLRESLVLESVHPAWRTQAEDYVRRFGG